MANVFLPFVLLVAIVSGATASVVGFGIGSILTPLFGLRYGMATAIALVAVPHAIGTALRCWRLRAAIDRGVLIRFGLLSAAGGFAGAMLYSRLGSKALTEILGSLLLVTAATQLSGWNAKWHPKGPVVGALGLASGFFGGVAGNQGGLRAAAMTAFALTPAAFVASSTATGLMVDAGRLPIYLWQNGRALAELWMPMTVASAGVLIGTLLGERVLLGLPRQAYARIVAGAIGVLGGWLILSVR